LVSHLISEVYNPIVIVVIIIIIILEKWVPVTKAWNVLR